MTAEVLIREVPGEVAVIECVSVAVSFVIVSQEATAVSVPSFVVKMP